jgi:hypothetical protein
MSPIPRVSRIPKYGQGQLKSHQNRFNNKTEQKLTNPAIQEDYNYRPATELRIADSGSYHPKVGKKEVMSSLPEIKLRGPPSSNL